MIAGFVFGVIGLWMIREAKRRANLIIAVIGVLLMSFTFFTSHPAMDWGVGFTLCAVAYFFWES